jgi:hypothetical protein
MKVAVNIIVLALAILLGASTEGAQSIGRPATKPIPPLTDANIGITVQVRLDNWVMDALDKDNKVIWTLNFFSAGGLRANPWRSRA